MNGDHNFDHPDHLPNQLDALMEAVHTHCRSCSLDVKVIPASGARYVLGITHEPECPDADEQPGGVLSS